MVVFLIGGFRDLAKNNSHRGTFLDATGGTVSIHHQEYGSYTAVIKTHVFTTGGFFSVKRLGTTNTGKYVQSYIIAAGGSGTGSGGGGAGGFTTSYISAATVSDYPVDVGVSVPGANGNNSSFNGTVAYGGGKGGAPGEVGFSGGSGGGGGTSSTRIAAAGATLGQYQGRSGSIGYYSSSSDYAGGGGGGASGPGGRNSNFFRDRVLGGTGYSISIGGVQTEVCSGGSSIYLSNNFYTNTSILKNNGNGGGGVYSERGANGIVIIYYPIAIIGSYDF